jgi:Holliday junction resolvase RusA-like endonuclease
MRYDAASTDAAWFHLHREAANPPIIARFTVDGEPVSKARARFTGYGSKARTYTPAKTLEAERVVQAAFRQAAPAHVPDPEATYGVTALFFQGTRQRRDVDNMLKLLLDGLNGVAWTDDNNVVEVSGRKVLEQRGDARTEVLIYRVGGVPRLTANCALCGSAFETYPSGRKKFCTPECANAAKRKPLGPCAQCGKPVNNLKAKHCSQRCAGQSKRRNAITIREIP